MDQLEKIRAQAKARQKKYYLAHKEELNKKRREIYAECIAKHKIPSPPPSPPSPETVNKTDFSKSNRRYHWKKISYEETMDALNKLIEVKGSLTIYEQSLKRLMKLTDCHNDVLKCLKSHKKIIDAIESSEYADNTKKTLYQTILKVIDTLHLNITPAIKLYYSKKFDEYKYISSENTKKKQEEETVMPFNDYIDKVKDTFGVNSKMYLLANLYKEIPIRDDFILKIVPTIKAIQTDSDVNEDVNFIVINKKDECTLITNKHKTDEKFTENKEKLSRYVSRLIRDYRQQENINYGDYLFGKSNLSSFISNANKKMGVLGGGINIIRRMKVSSLKKDASPSEKVELAYKMKHGVLTQAKYRRKQTETEA